MFANFVSEATIFCIKVRKYFSWKTLADEWPGHSWVSISDIFLPHFWSTRILFVFYTPLHIWSSQDCFSLFTFPPSPDLVLPSELNCNPLVARSEWTARRLLQIRPFCCWLGLDCNCSWLGKIHIWFFICRISFIKIIPGDVSLLF